MSSQEFEQFFESCFSNSFGAVHNGVDEQAIRNLKGEERKEAERLLLEALGTSRDTHSRPVIGLGLLGSQQAVEPLKKRLEIAAGIDRIYTAWALFQIEKYPEAEQIITDVLNMEDTSEYTRWTAVLILPGLGRTDRVVRALLKAMNDESVVGYSAARSLRTLFIEDIEVRDLLGQILLNMHDTHQPNFVPRNKLVQQATDLINSRLS